jgi:hypothetical protein
VNLDVTASGDRFAEVATGVYTSLKTGTTGSARILWKESGTGAKRGVVMLTGESPPTASDPGAAVTQTAHGFTVGTPIRFNGSAWVKSQANTEANARVHGIVATVVDANNFTYKTGGIIPVNPGVGVLCYLDPTTAGSYTTTRPATHCVPLFLGIGFNQAAISNFNAEEGASTAGTVRCRKASGEIDWTSTPQVVRSSLTLELCAMTTVTTTTTAPTEIGVKGQLYFIY